jgi:hypothetical protein
LVGPVVEGDGGCARSTRPTGEGVRRSSVTDAGPVSAAPGAGGIEGRGLRRRLSADGLEGRWKRCKAQVRREIMVIPFGRSPSAVFDRPPSGRLVSHEKVQRKGTLRWTRGPYQLAQAYQIPFVEDFESHVANLEASRACRRSLGHRAPAEGVPIGA